MTGQRLPFMFDQVFVHVLWMQTDAEVDRLERRVRQGVGVDHASEWCRWLLRTGLLEMLRACPQPLPMKCDGVALARKVESLLGVCNEHYANPTRPKSVELSAVEEINTKLAELMERLPAKAT